MRTSDAWRSAHVIMVFHYSDVTWASQRLRSSATRMFIQQFRITLKKNQRSTLLALCEGNPPVTGGFPSQWTSNAESVSISSRYHMKMPCHISTYSSVAIADTARLVLSRTRESTTWLHGYAGGWFAPQCLQCSVTVSVHLTHGVKIWPLEVDDIFRGISWKKT